MLELVCDHCLRAQEPVAGSDPIELLAEKADLSSSGIQLSSNHREPEQQHQML